MSTNIIELRNVSKTFEDNVVVNNLDLAIEDGEFVTLLGPSGSGKTTILRMIAGFEEATSGRILIGGKEMNDVPAFRRPLNTVFQQYALFPHLNVFDNIAFGLRMKGIPRKDIDSKVQTALEMVKMEKYIRAKIRKLSGGQQQRVAIARAIVNEPKVLLLDEPLGALDLKLRREMQLELKRIHRDLGITFIYVTHDQEEAMAMSDRIGVLHLGDMIQFSSPQEIYARPKTPFVAGFIGETNLLEATIAERTDESWTLESPSFRLKVPVLDESLKVGAKVTFSIRPEMLRVTNEAHDLQLRGVLAERVFVGAMVKTWIRIGSDLVLQCLENAVTSHPASVGEEVSVTWNFKHMVMF